MLVVWRPDHSLRHLLALVDYLDERRAGFRSLSESIGTTTTTGRLAVHLFGALGEFERDLLTERTAAGLEAAAHGRREDRPALVSPAELAPAKALLAEGGRAVAPG